MDGKCNVFLPLLSAGLPMTNEMRRCTTTLHLVLQIDRQIAKFSDIVWRHTKYLVLSHTLLVDMEHVLVVVFPLTFARGQAFTVAWSVLERGHVWTSSTDFHRGVECGRPAGSGDPPGSSSEPHEFTFEMRQLKVKNTCGIFITMNLATLVGRSCPTT